MLTQQTIHQILKSQDERLKALDTGFPRQVNIPGAGTSHALIISGVRRCGKSTWLRQVYHQTAGSKIFINFEDPRLAGFDLSDFNRLYKIALEQECTTYFFDEIQNIPQWENFVRFRLDEGYKVYITGSNATMLSRELGTKLTGRHLSKEMFPFSYTEFASFNNLPLNAETTLNYLKTGGFPEYIKAYNPEILMNAFNDIIIRDITLRFGIKNQTTLLQLSQWLVSNVGRLFTANSLRKTFNIGSSASIMEYISHFIDSYLFFFLPKYSPSYKVQLVNPRKIYCIDNGLITTNAISFTDDFGRLLENLVYINLRYTHQQIYYFAEGKECDFIVFSGAKPEQIIQVCWQLDENNLDRELNGIFEAMRYFGSVKAQIITHDQEDHFTKDELNVDVIPFHHWVLKSNINQD